MHKKFLFGLLGIALLTVLFSACTIRDAALIPKNPKVHMGNTTFLVPTITIKKGEKVDLIDDVSTNHVIVNGKWDGGKQVKTTEPGAPTVNLTFSGGDTSPIGPFNTAGTFNIYCTIHQGMNLVVTVK